MTEFLYRMDSGILLWIQNNLRNPYFTPIMKFITRLGDRGIVWIMITLLLLYFQKTRRVGVFSLVSLMLELIIVNLIMKNIFVRVRPYDAISGLSLLVRRPWGFSFPSGHAGSSFACAVILYRMTPRKYGLSALVLAFAIAFSRLYVGVHYPSDVLMGAILGTAVAAAVLKFLPKYLPEKEEEPEFQR